MVSENIFQNLCTNTLDNAKVKPIKLSFWNRHLPHTLLYKGLLSPEHIMHSLLLITHTATKNLNNHPQIKQRKTSDRSFKLLLFLILLSDYR